MILCPRVTVLRRWTASVALFLVALPVQAGAVDLSGFTGLDGRFFPSAPIQGGQHPQSGSAVLAPELAWNFGESGDVRFAPFIRLDGADDERTHWDIRELLLTLSAESWEFRAGIGRVFWGVTEFYHLVDIVNQTDLVEDIDEEEKLGQPMVQVSLLRDWGVLDVFVLPWFRERTFPGPTGRLRPGLVVDTERAGYESPAGEHHVDFALRYSHTLGPLDFGLYYFSGTGREPTLLPAFDPAVGVVLTPLYEQIGQTGLDAQVVLGDWLLKTEALYRTGQGEDFFATVTGFEYTLVNVLESGMDLGLIGEWAYDERGRAATTAFQNDLMGGFRLAVGDAESTEVLAGYVYDLDTASQIVSVEASRRWGDRVRVSLDAYFFINSAGDPILGSIRDDDVIRCEMRYYF